MLTFLKKTSIKTKFVLIPTILTLIVLTISPFMAIEVRHAFNALSGFVADDLTYSQHLLQIYTNISFEQKILQELHQSIPKEKQTKELKNIVEHFELRFAVLQKLISARQGEFEQIKSYKKFSESYFRYVSLVNRLSKLDSIPDDLFDEIDKESYIFSLYFRELNKKLSSQTKLNLRFIQNIMEKRLLWTLFGLLGIILVFYSIGLILTKTLSKPIENILKSTEEIAKTGNYNMRIPEQEAGEIDVLINGINQMLFEIQRMEEGLKQENNYLKDMLNSSPDMILAANEKDLIKFGNQMALTQLGYPNHKLRQFRLNYLLYQKNGNQLTPLSSKELNEKEISGLAITNQKMGLPVKIRKTKLNELNEDVQGSVVFITPSGAATALSEHDKSIIYQGELS